jgi:hypothetical protein
MKERPILFSSAMVRAILEGRKTQTRRVMKVPPPEPDCAWYAKYCPYGVPGSRLWVRETWGYRGGVWHSNTPDVETVHIAYKADGAVIDYERPSGGISALAKQKPPSEESERNAYFERYWKSWRPSIFMSRWASRITLEITDVRVQKLQEISEDDALAEGIHKFHSLEMYGYDPKGTPGAMVGDTAKDAFRFLWDSINAAKHPWAQNDWVFALTFRRLP